MNPNDIDIWSRGFVALPRKAIDLIADPTAMLVYMIILKRARHEPGPVVTGRGVLDLGIGQCVIGRDELARLLETTPDKIRTALARLKKLGIITTETTSRGTVVSLVNPLRYVRKVEGESPPESPPSPQQTPSTSPPNPQQTPTKDHLPLDHSPQDKGTTKDSSRPRRERRDVEGDLVLPLHGVGEGAGSDVVPDPPAGKAKKPATPEPAEALALADRLRDHILRRQPTNKEASEKNWQRTRPSWAKAFRLAHTQDGRAWDDLRAVLDWSQSDSFWSQNILSAAKLREKYDALDAKRTSAPAANGTPRPGLGYAPAPSTTADRRHLADLLKGTER